MVIGTMFEVYIKFKAFHALKRQKLFKGCVFQGCGNATHHSIPWTTLCAQYSMDYFMCINRLHMVELYNVMKDRQ